MRHRIDRKKNLRKTILSSLPWTVTMTFLSHSQENLSPHGQICSHSNTIYYYQYATGSITLHAKMQPTTQAVCSMQNDWPDQNQD